MIPYLVSVTNNAIQVTNGFEVVLASDAQSATIEAVRRYLVPLDVPWDGESAQVWLLAPSGPPPRPAVNTTPDALDGDATKAPSYVTTSRTSPHVWLSSKPPAAEKLRAGDIWHNADVGLSARWDGKSYDPRVDDKDVLDAMRAEIRDLAQRIGVKVPAIPAKPTIDDLDAIRGTLMAESGR